jgi:hypothetical protein
VTIKKTEQPESTIGQRPWELQKPGKPGPEPKAPSPQTQDMPGAFKSGEVARKEKEARNERTVDQYVPRGPSGPGGEAELPSGSFSRTREDVPPSLGTRGPKAPT